MWNGWLPREGLTGDPVGRVIKQTALNPAFTLPLILLARYTKRGSDLSILHEKAFGRIKTLFYIGLIRAISSYLSAGALDNWVKDEYDWNKEIVVVTGGSGGIGGHIVKLLAEKGTKVVVLDIIPMSFEAPSNVYYFKCDISSPAILSSVASEVRSTVGTPTILINNAGVARGRNILDATEKDIRFTFDVNTLAHYWLAKEFVPAMVKNNHGMVVTISSIAAYITVPNMTDYAASKAATLCFHEGLTSELKTRYNAPKVRTVVVNPGVTKTALFTGYLNDSKFLMPTLEVETVAEAVVKKVLTGTSGQVMVPGFAQVLLYLRTLPHWYQLNLRNKGEKIMRGWHGRQVVEPEEHYKAQQQLAEGSGSTVLVPPAKDE